MSARILLIEDDCDTREVYATSLRRSGYSVLEARDGDEGVRLARADRPDVIVMDLGMPRVDGWQATETLKCSPETAGIPVLAVTAHAHPFYRGRAESAGCSGFLEKSASLAQLLAEVARLLPRTGDVEGAGDGIGLTLVRAAEAAGELHGALAEALADLRGRTPTVAPAPRDDPRLHDALFRSFPRAVVITDAAGVVRGANAMAEALLGVPEDELRGTRLAERVAAGDRAAVDMLLDAAPGTRRPCVAELRVLPRDAPPLQVEATAARLAGDGPPRFVWVLRDLTSLRAAEAARVDRVELLSSALRALPLAVALLDLDGTVLSWNDAARQLLGWREEEVCGSRNPLLAAGFEDLLEVTAGVEGDEPVRGRMRHRDGRLVDVDVLRVPLTDSRGQARGAAAVLAAVDGAGPRSGAARDARRTRADPDWSTLLARGGGSLAERLRDGIAAGRYLGSLSPGDRLPSLRQVAAATGTHVRAASAAFRQLAVDGVMEVRSRTAPVLAPFPAQPADDAGDTAEWLARTVVQAFQIQVKVPQVPELARRWVAAVPLVCACVETCEDDAVALEHDLAQYWGMRPYRVSPGDRASLAAGLRAADVVLTTPFHEGAVRAAAAAAGKPVVVCVLNPRVEDAVRARLAAGPLTVVAADPEFARRLGALRQGPHPLRFVPADDAAAVAALDPAEPVLMTRAGERLSSARARLAAPPSLFLLPACPEDLARIVIRRHREAERGTAPGGVRP